MMGEQSDKKVSEKKIKKNKKKRNLKMNSKKKNKKLLNLRIYKSLVDKLDMVNRFKSNYGCVRDG
jgi:hypothetical protein